MKVRYQVFFSFIILILAFSGATSYFLVTMSKNQMKNMIEDISSTNRSFVKSYIQEMIKTKKNESIKIANDERVIKLYEEYMNGEDKRIEFIETSNLKAPYSSMLIFADNSGNILGESYEYYKWRKIINIQDAVNIIPRNDSSKFAISYLSFENGYLFVKTIVAIDYLRNGTRSVNGIVVNIMPINQDFLDDLKAKTGSEFVLITPENQKMTTLFDKSGNRIKDDLNIFPETKKIDVEEKSYNINYEVLKDFYEKDIGKIYILKDVTAYQNNSEELFLKEALVFVIIAFLGIIAMWVATTNFISPIERLKKCVTKITDEDSEYKININLIKREDEVGFLAKKFEKIKNELDMNRKKVKYYTEELESSYKEMKNYLYIVELKNKELIERLKEQKIIEEILSKGIKETNETGNFLRFLLKKINQYREYTRGEIVYKNGIDDSYERLVYIPEKDKYIESTYNENLKYLINDRVIVKENYIEIPISISGENAGNIKLEGIKITDNTEKVLDIIVNEIGIVLENSELYHKMDKKIMELSFLNSISIAISSANGINEMKKMIFDSVSVLFGITNHSVYIYEDGYFNEFKEEEGELIKTRVLHVEDISVYTSSKFEAIKVNKDYYIPLAVKERLIGVIKLDSLNNYKTMDKNIARIFLTQLSIVIQNNLMHAENKKRSFGIIKSLAEAIEEKDAYTRGHSERVMKYSIKIAEKMNLPAADVEKIQYAGILHDVGKIGISENILKKSGMLTDLEYEKIREHPLKGAKILMHMNSMKDIVNMVKYHHERPDGRGYPEGLKGEEIPLGARILAIADTFDAMTSNRPYRKGMNIELVKEEVKKYAGTQFDKNIAEIVLEMIEKNEIEIEKSGIETVENKLRLK